MEIDPNLIGIWGKNDGLDFVKISMLSKKSVRLNFQKYNKDGSISDKKEDEWIFDGFQYSSDGKQMLVLRLMESSVENMTGKWCYMPYSITENGLSVGSLAEKKNSDKDAVLLALKITKIDESETIPLTKWKEFPLKLTDKHMRRVELALEEIGKKRQISDVSISGKGESDPKLAESIYRECLIYLSGDGVQKDLRKALLLLRKSAEMGHVKAQNRLGGAYARGDYGLSKDDAKAFEWYLRAGERGYPDAQYNVGWCYDNGVGTKEDPTKAVLWYRKSAENNFQSAIKNLGLLLKYGRIGVSADIDSAISLLGKVAQIEDQFGAQFELGDIYLRGYGKQQDLRKAFSLFRKAAEGGHIEASTDCGRCFLYGWGIDKDEKIGLEWLMSAAKNGSGRALYEIGKYYYIHEQYSKILALDYATRASEKGVVSAKVLAAQIYSSGSTEIRPGGTQAVLEPNHRKAYDLFLSAITPENKELLIGENPELVGISYHGLGVYCLEGQAGNRDFEKAVLFFKKAAESGNAEGLFMQGHCAENGLGCDRNMEVAIRFYVAAKEQGSQGASDRLFELEHPWRVCPNCNGAGEFRNTLLDFTGSKCGTCGGKGKIR